MDFKFTRQDLAALLYVGWCVICMLRTASQPIMWLNIALMISAYAFSRTILYKRLILCGISCFGVIQALYVLLQMLGVFESNHTVFQITGFMGNPGQLGGFQSIAFVSSLSLMIQAGDKINRGVMAIVLFAIACSLIVSGSRAGWFAATIGICILASDFVSKPKRSQKCIWYVGIFFFICLVLLFLYLYRPESANARLLIWAVCMRMFLEKPLSGFGIGGFNRHYMLYQSEFLKSHPDHILHDMADNVSYPYNEFIHILVEQGVIGLALFFFMIKSVFSPTVDRRFSVPLISLLTFSFFSYPANIPELAVLFPLLLGSLPSKPLFVYRRSSSIVAVISFIVLTVSFMSIHIAEEQFIDKVRCRYESNNLSLEDKINELFIRDNSNLKINASYGTLSKHRPEVLNVMTLPLLFPSSDNWCIIGNRFLMEGDLIAAERYFSQASFMTPGLVQPKYLLWKTYILQGRDKDAAAISEIILAMPAKVENTRTLKMRSEVRNYYAE